MAESKAIRQARRDNSQALLGLENVIGLGEGFRETGGRRTDERCLVVLVRRKVPLEGLPQQQVVPKQIGGVRTDVMEIGDVRAQQARTERQRPAPGGVSLGHYQVTAGTFGVLVRDAVTGQRLVLSNNHVTANSNAAVIGDPILQPGSADGGRREQDVIAELLRFVPIDYVVEPSGCSIAEAVAAIANALARLVGSRHRLQAYQTDPAASNRVDAAVARPIAAGDVRADVLEIGDISGVRPVELGMAVRKSGRTTGLTTGEVVVIEATVTVGYGPSRRARFEGQIVTTAMSAPGDSGSLLVAADSADAVGLLFAGSDQVTLHNPIETVLEQLAVVLP